MQMLYIYIYIYICICYVPYSNEKLGTPISCAAFYGHDKVVKFLLDQDVSCNGNYAELKVYNITPCKAIYAICIQYSLYYLNSRNDCSIRVFCLRCMFY